MLQSYSILYIEDNREIAEEIAFFLEPRVKKLYCAYDGQEGLSLYNKVHPDIIITDIQMPIMNGIEMIKEIRERDSDIPIIITTAFNDSEYMFQALDLQVDGYLIKPLRFDKLIQRLQKVIEPMELKRALINKNSELEQINTNLDAIVKDKTQKLEYFYKHDTITGLSNFIELGEAIESNEYAYLILLDISNFSAINKQYGKDFGDAILRAVAEGLKIHINDRSQLFKIESDRFVILMKERELKTIELFCEQIISFFDMRSINVKEIGVYINFNIAITRVTQDLYPMINAEYALDIGKKSGSRYYSFYDDSQLSVKRAKDAIKWLNLTKEMIQNDQIEPYYQPIVDIHTKKIIKYEVLARANYNGEILSPYLFINSAEKLGMVSSITRMMITKSFAFFSGSSYSFSINITQRDLLDNYLINFLEQKLRLYNITPSQVVFEILENITLGERHATILKQLKALKNIGFKIAIDDFGVDNSNFSRLLEVDFDYIKLDGKFIQKLDTNEKDKLIVTAIVALAKSLRIETIAEYVENETLYNIVKNTGVDMAQGYYIGEPLPQHKTILATVES